MSTLTWTILLCISALINYSFAVSFNENYQRMSDLFVKPKAAARFNSFAFPQRPGILLVTPKGTAKYASVEPHLFGLSLVPIPRFEEPISGLDQEEPQPIPYDMSGFDLGTLDRKQLPFSFFRNVTPDPIDSLPTPFFINSLLTNVPTTIFFAEAEDGVRTLRTNRTGVPFSKVYVLVHDWLESVQEPILQKLIRGVANYAFSRPETRDSLLVVVLWQEASQAMLTDQEWRELPAEQFYSKPALNAVVVGRQLGLFLHFLSRERLISYGRDIHIIGLGLGAHLGHFACDWFRSLSRSNLVADIGFQKVGRLTALDPSSLGFEVDIVFQRSANTYDARFKNCAENVDVIHTTSMAVGVAPETNFFTGRYGFARPIGYVDFYPNQASKQPGCVDADRRQPVVVGCNQNMATEFFIDSLTKDSSRDAGDVHSLYGVVCDDFFRINLCEYNADANVLCYAKMGIESVSALTSGTYFLNYVPEVSSRKRQLPQLTSTRRPPMTRLIGIDGPGGIDIPLNEAAYLITVRQDAGFSSRRRLISGGRQAPNENEIFDRFPFDPVEDVAQGVDFGRSPPNFPSDMKDCGRFRQFPEPVGRVYQGYRPYAGQFPWTVCMYFVAGTYFRENFLSREQRKVVTFDTETVHSDRSLSFVLYENGWPGPNSNSQCSGSVIHRQWVLTAAHCFNGVPNGVPMYLAIGGTSCLRPIDFRFVVIEKRPKNPLRTIFMTDAWNDRRNELFRQYEEAEFDGPCPNFAFQIKDFNSFDQGSDIALIKLNEPLDIPEDWAPGRLNTVCLQAAAQVDLVHNLPIYISGYGKKADDDDFNPRPSLNFLRARVIAQSDVYSDGLDITIKVPHFRQAIDRFDAANVDINVFGVDFLDRQILAGDSGGPAVRYASDPVQVDGSAAQRAVQVGIVGGGVGNVSLNLQQNEDGSFRFDATYLTRVATYLDFISGVISGSSGARQEPVTLFRPDANPERREPSGDDFE